MSTLERLESLLARVQRNRAMPRHDAYDDDDDSDTPTIAPPPADSGIPATGKRAKASPLEAALNDAAAPQVTETRKAVERQPVPTPKFSGAPVHEPPPAAPPAPRAAPPLPAAQAAASPIAAREIPAAPLAPSNAVPVRTTGDAVVVEESTFGDLLSRSLSLRTR